MQSQVQMLYDNLYVKGQHHQSKSFTLVIVILYDVKVLVQSNIVAGAELRAVEAPLGADCRP